jgi:serine/threonine protein kinase
MVAQGFPKRFGKYHLLRPLAQGGMGALYLAVSGERGMEKLCALKTVLPNLADREYVGRFRDEAKVVVKLQHGNLVTVFDAGQVGGELYLAMEFIAGKDLRAVWNRCARKGIAFPVDVAVHIVKELCRGLAYAHSFGDLKLVHRDVSPPNVLLAYSGEVKLTDFGLASSTLKREKTAPGVVYGKVSYMSPEQARGETLDGRTDLYTAGVLLWELLTGRQLFPQGDRQPGDLLQDVKHPQLEPPSTRASRVTPELDALTMKALALAPEERFQSGEEMRAALAGWLAQNAPATDAARIAGFLDDLFGEDIERERADCDAVLVSIRDRLRAAPASQPPPTAIRQGGRSAREKAEPDRAGPAVTVPGAASPSGRAALAVARSQPQADSAALVGQVLDTRYHVRSLIGEGGMGRVYEAEHVEIGKRVAIKVLHPVYSRTAEVVERFRREARAASKIGHPNIVDVTDSGTTVDGSVYFVMEYLEGVELARVIGEQGALELTRALAIASQICRAVAAAHAAGIIHRDLKPENIFLVAREGNADFVKVLDFGIAKSAELEDQRDRRLTHPGMAMGTPEYMAPEQAAGKPYDHRIDVYSTGAILYEMLTGVPPYQGENFMEVLTKKATAMPIAARELRPELPEEIDRLVERALAHSPEERPPSMEAFDYEITKALAGRGAAVGKLLGLAPEWGGDPRGSNPSTRTPFAGTGTITALSGEVAGVGRRKRMVTWGMVGGAVGGIILLAGVAASRRTGLSAPAAGVQAFDNTSFAPAPPPSISASRGRSAHVGTPGATRRDATVPAVAPPAERPAPPEHPAPRKPAAREASAPRRLAEARQKLAGGHYNEARVGFTRLLDSRERAPALLGLGEIAFQQSNYGESAKLARQSLAAGGGAQARVLLGNAYFKQQRYGDAIREYRTVLRAQPDQAEARRGLEAAERRQTGK